MIGFCDLCVRRSPCRVRGEGGNHDDPHPLRPGDPVGSAFMIRLPRIVEAPKEEVAAPARTGAAALKPQ
jgi:hypothetical protein